MSLPLHRHSNIQAAAHAGRNRSLDILRAVAILLVFCFHSQGFPLIGRFGWLGVDLFFILSGFLVSGLLFREYQATGSLLPGRFLIRRGFKIYPQFYFLIAVTALWTLALDGWDGSRVLAEVLFVQNYFTGLWSHLWSLAVEEHFYLLLTAAMVLLARRGGADPFAPLRLWIPALCGATLAVRTLTWYLNPDAGEVAQVMPSHLRMDTLAIGVLIAYYQSFHPAVLLRFVGWIGPWLPQASILLLAPASFLLRGDVFMVTLGFSMVACGFGLLLLGVLYPMGRARKDAAKPPATGTLALARLGQVSYGFYLWHAPVLLVADWGAAQLAERGMELPFARVTQWLVTFAVSTALAFLTTRLIEDPCLRLRNLRFPSHTRANGTAPAFAGFPNAGPRGALPAPYPATAAPATGYRSALQDPR